MAKSHRASGDVIHLPKRRDLFTRRVVEFQLPEFVICALEARVAEANAELPAHDAASLNDYVESELVNIITVRDVAELEARYPGFAAAVQHWLLDIEA